MRRVAVLVMLLLSLSPSPAAMAGDWVNDWSRSDLDYIGYSSDGETLCVVDENGEPYNVRLRLYASPEEGNVAIPTLVALPVSEFRGEYA